MGRYDYDKVYEIRLAQKDDIESIMSFIDTYWRKGHILAVNREFFEYEFLEDDGRVNFILAIKRETGSLEGIMGFLKASRDKERMDIWGSIWKVKDGNVPFLGMQFSERLYHLIGYRWQLSTGLNPSTAVPQMKKMRFNISKMKQYYFLGQYEEFKVAKIEHFPELHGRQAENVDVRRIDFIEELQEKFVFAKYKENVPYKDAHYIGKRFFRHPIYHYDVYGIFSGENIEAFFVAREDEACGRKVLRIVDFLGEQKCFGSLYLFFCGLTKEKGYEYIDFYCHGFEEAYLTDAGFTLRTDDDDNIIPNYFHPFVRENIEIYIILLTEKNLFFKADGDQDRPN